MLHGILYIGSFLLYMDTLSIILGGALILLFIYFIRRERRFEKTLGDIQQLFKEQEIKNTSGEQSMYASLQDTKQHLYALNKTISDISHSQQEISSLKEEILGLSKLMNIPKMRGNMGEMLLEQLLRTYLHSSRFSIQHRFATGHIVDAAIFLPEGKILPIDAKFPLENFRAYLLEENESSAETYFKEFKRNFKKHVDDISSKYILHKEDTLDFALMYIPSEHIYYELISRAEDSLNYALSKSVIPASPAIMFSYIHIILMGFRSVDIEHRAEFILTTLKDSSKSLYIIDEELQKAIKQGKYSIASMERAAKIGEDMAEELKGLDQENITQRKEEVSLNVNN